MKFLVLTNYDNKIIKSKNKVYLGDWCKKRFYPKEKVFENIWDNTNLIKKDYFLLKKIIYKKNKKYSKFLFKYHNKIIPIKVWEKMIFIWLVIFVHSSYFRWKTVKKNLSNKKLKFINITNLRFKYSVDTKDYLLNNQNSHEFNYLSYKNLILFLNKKNIKIINKKFNKLDSDKHKNLNFVLFNLKNFFFDFNIFLENFFLKPKIFFLESINYKFYLIINIIFYQLPFKLYNTFNWNFIKNKINDDQRKFIDKISLSKNHQPTFENYLDEIFIDNLPSCYLSGFKTLYFYAEKIKIKPRLIFSAFGHIYNEVFKLWSFLRLYKNKSKVFSIQHGGHHQLIYTSYDYEFKNFNKHISWIKKYNKYSKSLPIIKYFFKQDINYLSNEKILFVGNDKHDFFSRITPGPVSNNSYFAIKDLIQIHNKLKKNIASKIFYIGKKKNIDHDKNIIIKNINFLKNESLRQNLKKARLVICTYPMTTFIDSLLSCPTILVCRPDQWQEISMLSNSYKSLKKNKIIFSNPEEAADHINNFWDRIDDWWNSKNVNKAKNDFLNNFDYSFNNKKNLVRWSKFIQKQYKGID